MNHCQTCGQTVTPGLIGAIHYPASGVSLTWCALCWDTNPTAAEQYRVASLTRDYIRAADPATLTFERLRQYNASRCETVFHPIDEWSETDWMCAAAGEIGEAANKVKKRRRGEDISVDDVIDELADAVIYADLLATRMGGRLEDGIRRKFDEVSKRRGSRLFLGGGRG